MYGSIIIVNLSSKIKYKHIESLQDLSSRKNVKILIRKNSFVDDSIEDNLEFSSLKGRIKYFEETNDPKQTIKLLSKLLSGSHVLIDTIPNLVYRTKKVPEAERCNFGIDRFHFSKQKLFSQSVTWIFSKKMDEDLKEKINLNLIWFQQTGLFSTLELRAEPNSGIESSLKMNSSCPKITASKTTSCPSKSSSSKGPSPLKFQNVSNVFLLLCSLVGSKR